MMYSPWSAFDDGTNINCKCAIEKAIAQNFDGMHLNADAVKTVVAEFGYDRVGLILAHTIQYKYWDRRFSQDNKVWAETLITKDTAFQADKRPEYVVQSHPAVLDGFVNQFRRVCVERR